MPRALIDTNILISGLFYKGNERELLKLILFDQLDGLLPEDVVDECIRIIMDKFEGIKELQKVLELFSAILSKCRIIPREIYKNKIASAKGIIKDTNDVPVLACALKILPEYFVTGDIDFHIIQNKVDFKIIKTKQSLKIIAEATR